MRRGAVRLAGRPLTVPVMEWPQAPAGLSLGWASVWPCRSLGAGPRRGTSSQTARCGVSRFKAAVCAVCCGGTPTRPRPTVSYAADRRRGDEAVTDGSLLHSDHRRALARHKDQSGTVCLFPSHRRDDADETEGRGRVGVPPQQTAHTAAILQLTPHHAVCEEVPRPGPARPTRRTHREPLQPGRRLRPSVTRRVAVSRDKTEASRDQPHQARPALEDLSSARPATEAILDQQGRGWQVGTEPSTKQPGRRLRPSWVGTAGTEPSLEEAQPAFEAKQ